jgi:hypothetical protein
MFQSVGLLRGSCLFPAPIALANRQSIHAHKRDTSNTIFEPSMLSRSSKNNCRPSATFSGVIGLSAGIDIAS